MGTRELLGLLGLRTPSAVANLRARDPEFPQPLPTSGREHRYDLEEVQQWAARRRRVLHLDVIDAGTSAAKSRDAKAAPVRPAGTSRAWPAGLELLDPPPVAELEHLVDDTSGQPDAVAIVDAAVDQRAGSEPGYSLSLTSPALVTWVLAAAGPITGRIIDPACGWGGLLAAAADLGEGARFLGIDSNAVAVAGARARLRARPVQATCLVGDSLAAGALDAVMGTGDIVLVDAPSGAESPMGANRVPRPTDPRYGPPPRGEQGFVWIDLALALLAPGGRAIVVTHQGALQQGGRHASFRDALLAAGAVSAVIALPKGVRSGRAGALAIWVLRRPDEIDAVPLVIDGGALEFSQPDGSDKLASATKALATLLAAQPNLEAESPLPPGVTRADEWWSEDDAAMPGPRRRPGPRRAPEADPGHVESVIARITEARGRLSRIAELLGSGQVGMQMHPLSELVADGRVLAYIPVPPRLPVPIVGAAVPLEPFRPRTRNVGPTNTQPVGDDRPTVSRGDVLVRPRETGYEAVVATVSGQSGPDAAFVLRTADERIAAESIALGINALRESGWRWSSRGPATLDEAWDGIWVPERPDEPDAAERSTELQRLLSQERRSLDELARHLTDISLLARRTSD